MRNIIPLLLLLLLPFLLVNSQDVKAADQEHSLKAGFLYNFARYGQWQNSSAEIGEFILCSPDAAFIDTAKSVLHQRNVDGRPIVIYQINFELAQVAPCHLLFITSETFEDWLNWQKKQLTSFSDTMIVGESKGIIESGGHIRFFIASGRVRFEISPEQLLQSDITMSSKVLRLGRVLER